ncbi:MORC family CW-type zinc finger protein 3a isoform X2 [Parambassis ranga]|nr:MORC family CW-type zinc finger protein 3 isoform X2 [Parambassis ranga]
MDNGNGLDHETMHKMLSFGYSDKTAVNGLQPIGIYGNGFKSGSMRLGKDAIVFSKSRTTSCVGMLSQTYLETIGAKQIIVPIVCFEVQENSLCVKEEHKASLQDILQYSPFEKEEELLTEINAISSSWSTGKTGTRIIIWNLRSTQTTEFDFKTDRYDIRIPSEVYEELNTSQNLDRATSHVPESVYSLRAYCSILYLKPRMQINVRGQKVKSQLIAKSLAHIRKDHYKPIFLNKRIPITFGYNTKSKDQYGIMMYHKNRLIKAYERVGCQLKANNKGIGVIGVIECNFLDPTHNKQSFMETDKYRKTMNNLGIKLEEYWQEIRYRKTRENPNNTTPVEDTIKRPDQIWVQCDDCLQWRKLPDGIDCSKLPDKWFCRLNPDPQFRSCVVLEEPEDSDGEQPSYRKTYKQQEREIKKKQGTNTPKMVAFSPTTPRSRLSQGGALRAESSSPSIVSPAACSPSTSTGLPVISSVCSLSVEHLRGKRSQPASPHTPLKRPRLNGPNRRILNTPSSVDVTPQNSPAVPVINNDDDETDDDILILETGSTPKPQNPPICFKDIKKEEEQNDNNVDMQLECSNDDAVDATTEPTRSVGSAAVEASPQEVSSTTTQTEVPTFKEEVQSQNPAEGQNKAEQSVCNGSGEDHSSNVCNIEQSVFKQESSEETHTSQNVATYLKSAGNAFADNSDEKFSSHYLPILAEEQRQQDQLLELMQETALERDSLKQQVCELTAQLQDMQRRLQEPSHTNETSHQACQTEETEQEKDYKTLFEKARNKVNELIQDKVALMTATETKASLSNAQGEADDADQIAQQVDFAMQELDQRTKEKNELHLKLDNLEEERATLAAQCEELRLSLQQQKENAPEESKAPQRVTGSPIHSGEARRSVDFGTHSSSENSRSLIALRHNIGRLLVTFVPALDLEQVNYECNVIDEILEQVLDDVNSVFATKLISK